MEMIPLQNLNKEHIGFLLHAGLPDAFATTVGQWKGDCVIMALPTQPELFNDPAFLLLADHKDAGEHRITVTNDGSTIAIHAVATTGATLFIRLPQSGPGSWGTLVSGVETKMGNAVRVAKAGGG